MKRTIALLLVLVSLFSSSSIAYATEGNEIIADELTYRIQAVVSSWDSMHTVSETKELLDFAGNDYTAVEYIPSGYIIYNNASATIVERSENSPSPFLDLYGNLFYGGPTYYYQYNEATEEFVHTVLGYSVDSSDVSARSTICAEVQEELINQMEAKRSVANTNIAALTEAYSGFSYVGYERHFFANLTSKEDMGHWGNDSGACCGYRAAALMLLWYNYYRDHNFIDSRYLKPSSAAFNGDSFTAHLYDVGTNLGYGDYLNAAQVASIMYRYLWDERGFYAVTWNQNAPSKSDIIAQLRLNRPVVYVDEFFDPTSPYNTVNHDIVVYGWNDSTNELVAHFGWPNYSEVICSSPPLALFLSSACTIINW